jgi:hypothetical protein
MALTPRQSVRVACIVALMMFGGMIVDWIFDTASPARGLAVLGCLVVIIATTLGDVFRRSWMSATVAFLFGCSVLLVGLVSGWAAFWTMFFAAVFGWGLEVLVRKVRAWKTRRPYSHTDR